MPKDPGELVPLTMLDKVAAEPILPHSDKKFDRVKWADVRRQLVGEYKIVLRTPDAKETVLAFGTLAKPADGCEYAISVRTAITPVEIQMVAKEPPGGV